MPELPKGRKKKAPRSKTQYHKDGSVNWKARVPFYGYDPDHASMYHTTRWKKIREVILHRNPTCPICMHQNKVVPATDVDHVFAHKGAASLFYDLDNLWALCKYHHNVKTGLESNGCTARGKQEWLEAILRAGED